MRKKVIHKASFSDEITTLELENQKVAYQAAAEGIVLLENDGVLPIQKGKIALFGAGSDMTIKGGTGSGEVNERHAISIMEGLEHNGFTVTTKGWIQDYARLYKEGEELYAKEFRKKVRPSNLSNIMNLMSDPYRYPFGQEVTIEDVEASDTDTCIYVVSRQAGEGSDRKLDNGDNGLSAVEKQNLAFCAYHYEKMIVVINVGSSFDMSFLDEIEGINAVVFFCQQGTMGGSAFADLIEGKVTPSGKLTDTWAQRYEDIPFAKEYSYLNGNVEEEYYKEGIYVGYRYFDSYDVEPKYPFGYGLSYTDFSIEPMDTTIDGRKVQIQVQVKNTGSTYSGKEIVQIYVSCPQTGLAKEYQRLVAFAKTKELEPGEEQNLCITFDVEALSSYREADAATVLEAGDYWIRIGNQSRNTMVCAVMELEDEVIISQHEHICPVQASFEELSGCEKEEMQDIDVKRLKLAADAVDTIAYTYEETKIYESELTDKLLSQMSVKEMIQLTVGNGMFGGRLFFDAPGSAGYTTSELLDLGVPNVALADGPAGLRLQKVTVVTKNGKLKPVEPNISLLNYFPSILKKGMLGDPKKNPSIYQFTTAFPVGMALAQTWNIELVEKVGDAVGKEMERYGVTYWLAPALNIHRNPLCGRNFEYYSEDPVISGKFAAAISRGVQKHRGCYVTMKHYCCNNQEDNRNKTNANVSERTLREIYLKAFEIAVKEGRPGSIMSSYNKVNGVYANNSYDLLTKVLRNEWGFDQLVMTDWFATGKNVGSHHKALAAGNDLLMPGGSNVVKAVLKAYEAGEVTEEEIKKCAANVLKGIVSSRIYQGYLRLKK